MIDVRLVICGGISLILHFAVERGLAALPPHVDDSPPRPITVAVFERHREPPPEPVKLLEVAVPKPLPPPPPPPPVTHPTAHPTPPQAPKVAAVAQTAPADHPAPLMTESTSPTSTAPVFTSSISGSSQGGTSSQGTSGSRGTAQAPGAGSAAVPQAPKAGPIAAFQATKLPLPTGHCVGTYTPEALQAGTEGTVVLDLVVGADGVAREIEVVSGLDHGLTQAAIAALHACRFKPGEQDGAPVAVKIRGFKIRFTLPDAN